LSAKSAMPAAVPAVVSTILAAARGGDLADPAAAVTLWEVWAQVRDPRDARGRRHRLPSILVQAAVTSGATTFAGIVHWIGVAPQHVLVECRIWHRLRLRRRVPPHPDTISRVLEQLDVAELDAAYAGLRSAQLSELYDAGELIAMTVDGKTQRGTTHGGVRVQHRMGAMLAEDALVVAQLDVDGKSNEINAFAPLRDQIPCLRNVVISADMMHTRRKHAWYLHKRGAYFVLPVGGNQPGLFDQLDALPWRQAPIGWMTYDRGHGRQEIRIIRVLPAPKAVKFPYVKQVFLIERHFHDLDGKPSSSQAVLGVTSLAATQAGPEQLASFIRGEWSIENRDHYVRDVTLGEGRCRVRTGALPSVLAVMRSHAIGALRLLGFTNIAEATRWAPDDCQHPLIAQRRRRTTPSSGVIRRPCRYAR
jgi:predicted transposase YbfD/YdcC